MRAVAAVTLIGLYVLAALTTVAKIGRPRAILTPVDGVIGIIVAGLLVGDVIYPMEDVKVGSTRA